MTAPGKVVLVTGAGGGIGGAVVRRFAAAGWRPVLTDLSAPALEKAADEAGGAPFRTADLRSRAACAAVVAWAAERLGRLDGLVNAAGVWREGPTAATSEEDFDVVFDVNVSRPFLRLRLQARAAVPRRRQPERRPLPRTWRH